MASERHNALPAHLTSAVHCQVVIVSVPTKETVRQLAEATAAKVTQ